MPRDRVKTEEKRSCGRCRRSCAPQRRPSVLNESDAFAASTFDCLQPITDVDRGGRTEDNPKGYEKMSCTLRTSLQQGQHNISVQTDIKWSICPSRLHRKACFSTVYVVERTITHLLPSRDLPSLPDVFSKSTIGPWDSWTRLCPSSRSAVCVEQIRARKYLYLVR